MTFSIIGRSPDGAVLGVAVASKFLAAGACVPAAAADAGELARRLAATGYASGDLRRDLYDWMGRENFEERWREDRLDPVVLQHLRATTA
jgi:uncharacterized Ntn-hydrolase superfamily protein